jgi:hypothetical protein
VFGTYVEAGTGAVLGDVAYLDGPAPGNDAREVTVNSPLALACLQRRPWMSCARTFGWSSVV